MTLLDFQQTIAAGIMAPRAGRRSARPVREAGSLIKPNRRLTAFERLEIYRQSYWVRILDSFGEDFPGLSAILGQRAFNRLAETYLNESPSQSFTMRDLGSKLERWLRDRPDYGGANLTLALDMVRLEWAHIEAFDGAARKPLGPEDLLEPRAGMKLGIQPYITLLELRYPVDDLRIRVQATLSLERSGAASNTMLRRRERGVVRRYSVLKPEPTFLAVHRVEFTVYYRRLTAGEFRILTALRDGIAIEEAVASSQEFDDPVETWFAAWSRLGWLCHAGN